MGLVTTLTQFIGQYPPSSENMLVSVGMIVFPLMFILFYMNLLDPSSYRSRQVRNTLIGAAIPLLFAFFGILLVNMAQVVGYSF